MNTPTQLRVRPPQLSDGLPLLPVSTVAESADGVPMGLRFAGRAGRAVLQEIHFIEWGTWPQQHPGWDVGSVDVLALTALCFVRPLRLAPLFRAGHLRHMYELDPRATAGRVGPAVLASDGQVVDHFDGLVREASTALPTRPRPRARGVESGG